MKPIVIAGNLSLRQVAFVSPSPAGHPPHPVDGYRSPTHSVGVSPLKPAPFTVSPLVLVLGLVAGLGFPSAQAAPPRFHEEIAPILSRHCIRCHGGETQESGLRLDRPEFLIKAGHSGEPLFVPGNANASYLFQLVSGTHPDLKMPPKGTGLSDSELTHIRRWIADGAPLPTSQKNPPPLTTEHWSFQPLSKPPVPDPVRPQARNPIDHFIFELLTKKQLVPSPEADRRTLIRRLFLIALGLPPTPEEVESFVADPQPDAYERQVDQVLASPHYGERWARHWLDVVRYADTNGFETNRERKTAYRYRDYVIDAFNRDLPYDQFIRDQIAGDTIGTDVGTGFLVAGPYDIVKSPDLNLTLAQRQDELADMINTTATTFLGLTVGCARCHNHKFDPILQRDYYAIQAVFAGVNHGERALKRFPDPAADSKIARLEARRAGFQHRLTRLREQASTLAQARDQTAKSPPVNYQRNVESFPARQIRFVKFEITATANGAEPCIDELEVFNAEGKNVALSSHGTTAKASGTLPGFSIHKLEHIHDGQTGNNRSWISATRGQGWITLEFPETETIGSLVWGRDRQGQFADRLPTQYEIKGSQEGETWQVLASSSTREPFEGKPEPDAFLDELPTEDAQRARRWIAHLNDLDQQLNDLRNGPSAWVANFKPPPTTHRLYRGEPNQPREPVSPDGLTVLGSLGMKPDEPEPERRRRFAQWIARPEHPLTARVLVNRIWHYVFGRGLVATPSDLGVNGLPPSHPQLLDWLARAFLDSDWSIKHLQRLILTSHTFRQSSHPHSDGLERDAGSQWLWRFPPRRLEAEAIRDSALAVADELDRRQGGPGFYLHRVQVENVMHYFPKERFGREESRRMVYLFKIRQEQDAIFGSFDCPDGNQTIPSRSRSNTPLQALNLFNSRFVIQLADRLGDRLVRDAGSDPGAQIDHAFRLLLARPPDEIEREASLDFLRREGHQAFCRALLNTSEFLFVF